MWIDDLEGARERILRLLSDLDAAPTGRLTEVVELALDRRAALLALAAEHPTPFYAFDRAGFRDALQRFSRAFAPIAGHRPFYAIKSNPHPLLLEEAARQGYGFDVSSGRELDQALAFPGCPILFSGPAKSPADLDRALRHADRVIVQLDSWRELERLDEAAGRAGRSVRAGVRVSTDHHGAWSKFGIPLGELPQFWRAAARLPRVELCGIQAHLSWNRDPEPYRRVIAAIGTCLREAFTPAERASVAFLDVGGGYRPHRTEGFFPADHPLGQLVQAANDAAGAETRFRVPYFLKDSVPLDAYAGAIAESLAEHIAPLADCALYTEPGRIVSTPAMHLVMRIVDRKSDELVIVDGGIHMVGWEKFLAIYLPVINLSRPAGDELVVRIGGSLCDCEDVMGNRCYAASMEEGDVLVVPLQGAYGFSTAQAFIRDIPKVHELRVTATP
jgi:diaminopimelate decarboxylase